MPINANDLGPGLLTLGTGSPLDVSAQLTGCKITPTEVAPTTTDAVKVLSGESLAGSTGAPTFTYVLEGTFLQDLNVGGVVALSWADAGEEVDFTYEPNSALGASVEGTLVLVPLTIGGDEVDAGPMDSDFSWRIVGTPTPTFAA